MRSARNIFVVLLFVGSSLVAGVQPVEAQVGPVDDRLCFSDAGECDDGANVAFRSNSATDFWLHVFFTNGSSGGPAIKFTPSEAHPTFAGIDPIWIDENTGGTDLDLGPTRDAAFALYDVFCATDSEPIADPTAQATVCGLLNAPPEVHDGNKTVFEGQTLAFSVNATDEDGDALHYDMSTDSGATLNEMSGHFSWTPASAGTFYANISANDTRDVGWKNITITVLAPATFLTPDDTTQGVAPRLVKFTLEATKPSLVADNATFEDGLGNSLELGTFANQTIDVTYPSSGTYIAWFNGTYDGTPFAHNVTTAVLNAPPVLETIGEKTTVESKELAFLVSATNGDSDDLTFVVQTDIPAGEFDFDDNDTGGKDFSWTPSLGQEGTYYANFTVNDTKDVDWENITITVDHRSTALTSDWPAVVAGSPLTFTLNATDPSRVADATFEDDLGNSLELGTFANQTIDVTYPSDGTYTASFKGIHADEDAFSHSVSVDVLPGPLTSFTADTVEGTSPLQVEFSLVADDWVDIPESTFDDGLGNVEDIEAGPGTTREVTYNQNGTYVAWFNGTHGQTGPFSHQITIHLSNTAPILAIGDRNAYRAHELVFSVVATDPDVEDTVTYALASNATGATLDTSTGRFLWNVTEEESGWYYANFTSIDTKESDWKNVTITVQAPSTVFSSDVVWGAAPLEVEFSFSDSDWDDVDATEFTDGREASSDVVFVADGTVKVVYDEPGDYVARFNGTHETEGQFWYSIPVTVVPNTPPEFTDGIRDQVVVKNSTLDFIVTASDAEDTDLILGLQTNATGHTSKDLPGNKRKFTWTPTDQDIGWYYANFTVHDGNGGVDWKNITITVTTYSTVLRSSGLSGYVPYTVTYKLNATDPSLVADNATFEDGLGDSLDLGTFANRTIDVTYTSAGTHTAWFNGTHNEDGVFNHSLNVKASIDQNPVLQSLSDPTIRENASLRLVILATDSEDPEGLTYTVQTDIPDDSIGFDDNATAGKDFSWQTGYGDAGTYYANFTVQDGNGGKDSKNITITVLDNQPPSLQQIDDLEVVEGMAFTMDIEATDDESITGVDVALSPEILEYQFDPVADEPGSWRFSWSPLFGSAGSYYANFTARDDEGLTGHLNITLTVYNSPPVLEQMGDRSVTEGDRIRFTPTASDPDGHSLEYSIDTDLPMEAANQGSFDVETGVFSWTAVIGDAGTYYVDFIVTDGGVTVHESVTVTVLQNHAPVLDPVGDRFIEAGDLLRIQVTASDADGDDLVFGLRGTPIPDRSYAVNEETGGMEFTWLPGAADVGTHNIDFTVQDGAGAMDFERVTVTVRPSIPPVLDPIGDISLTVGESYEQKLTAVDPGDEAALVFTLATNASAASIQGDTLRFTPGQEDAGWYWAEVTVTDDDGFTDSQNITITVAPSTPQTTFLGVYLDSGAGGVRAATTMERQALTDVGFDVTDEDEVEFIDDDGDGDIDSIRTTSGRIKTEHDLESLAILVLVDTKTGLRAVMDFNAGQAFPVKEIEGADIAVDEQGRQGDEDRVAVTVPKEAGWIHIEIDDPAPGQAITSLERSDGMIMELDQAWRTEEGRLHILDDPDTTYTIGFEPRRESSLAALWVTVAVLGSLVLTGGAVAGMYWMGAKRGASRDDMTIGDSWALASDSPVDASRP